MFQSHEIFISPGAFDKVLNFLEVPSLTRNNVLLNPCEGKILFVVSQLLSYLWLMFQKQPGVVAKRLDKGNTEFHPFNTKAVITFQLKLRFCHGWKCNTSQLYFLICGLIPLPRKELAIMN